jgi:hypothetical protein
MQPEGSKKPTTGPYPEADEASPHLPNPISLISTLIIPHEQYKL